MLNYVQLAILGELMQVLGRSTALFAINHANHALVERNSIVSAASVEMSSKKGNVWPRNAEMGCF